MRLKRVLVFFLLYSLNALSDNVFVVTGVTGEVSNNVAVYLSSLAKARNVPDWQIRELSQEALRALGYFHGTFNIKRVGANKIKVSVNKGEPILIEKSDITLQGEAIHNMTFVNAIKNSGLHPGERLDQGKYEALKSLFSDLALKQGYFDAKILTSELAVNPSINHAFIHIIFDSGKRYDIGETYFIGSQINEQKLYSLIPYQVGQPYLAEDLGLLNQRLANVGWFSSVYAGADIEQKSGREVPVNVALVPQVKNKMEVGVGYTTNHGPRLKFKWRKPWINSSGHSLNVQSEISQYEPKVQLAYKIPLEDVLHDYYQLIGGIRYVDAHNTLSTDLNAGIERHWNIGQWDQAVFFRWLYEDYKQGAFEKGVANLGLVGISYSHAYFSPGIVPKNAQKTFFSVGYSNVALGAKSQLWDLHARQGWIRTMAENHRIVFKMEAGAAIAHSVTDVPPALRYFIGGDSSLRGYSYESISPRDSENKQIGGQYMATVAAEYQYRLVGNWWGATFYDVGSSWTNAFSLKRGTGIGVRWASPIGSIRLDIAWGLDRPGTPFEIHLTLGPEL